MSTQIPALETKPMEIIYFCPTFDISAGSYAKQNPKDSTNQPISRAIPWCTVGYPLQTLLNTTRPKTKMARIFPLAYYNNESSRPKNPCLKESNSLKQDLFLDWTK